MNLDWNDCATWRKDSSVTFTFSRIIGLLLTVVCSMVTQDKFLVTNWKLWSVHESSTYLLSSFSSSETRENGRESCLTVQPSLKAPPWMISFFKVQTSRKGLLAVIIHFHWCGRHVSPSVTSSRWLSHVRIPVVAKQSPLQRASWLPHIITLVLSQVISGSGVQEAGWNATVSHSVTVSQWFLLHSIAQEPLEFLSEHRQILFY